MISLAALVIARAATGARIDLDIVTVPAYQWAIYWSELAPLCPSRVMPVPVKQRNALRVEILPSRDARCTQRSPDGRGLAWLMSGGDPLSYGACCESACPRVRQ